MDSVQEYSVITNGFDPQYGRAAGGVVNLATTAGTNRFHGSVYEYNRVSALAANTYNPIPITRMLRTTRSAPRACPTIPATTSRATSLASPSAVPSCAISSSSSPTTSGIAFAAPVPRSSRSPAPPSSPPQTQPPRTSSRPTEPPSPPEPSSATPFLSPASPAIRCSW